MPTFQGVIGQESGVAGWSEVYYINAADIAAAMILLQGINDAQLAIQAATVFTVFLRTSDVTIRGDGLLNDPITANGSLPLAGGDTLADLNLAALFRFNTADQIHRVHHFIKGVRASDITTGSDGRTILTPVYRALAAVTTYATVVKANSVNWQKRSIPPVTAALTVGGVATDVSVRRSGRPFNLFRGRRRTA